jgi:hypothetical protein
MEAVVARVNRTSALWQLFATMGDLILVADDGSARYLEEVPVDFAHDGSLAGQGSYFIVTLEYGPDHDQHDPFDISMTRITQSEVEHADKGRYLHPVIRFYQRKRLVAEHHMTENLENDWTGTLTHREPLLAFFGRTLSAQGTAAATLSETA